MRRYLIGLAAVVLFAGSAAQAQELSTSSSSGSMTITVYIPPIAPAIRAAQSGAIGLWTIDGKFDGLMLRVADVGSPDPVTLYTRPGNLVAIAAGQSGWTSRSLIPAATTVNRGGLMEATFDTAALRHAQSVTIVGL
jgi:hypothetical protein